jgi:hypothetical protein
MAMLSLWKLEISLLSNPELAYPAADAMVPRGIEGGHDG